MKDYSNNYVSGEQILPGDIVALGTGKNEIITEVEFVIGIGEYDSEDNWYKNKFSKGFMIKFGPILYEEADEDLRFIRRGENR